MQRPVRFPAGLEQAGLKRRLRPFRFEDIRPVVAPVDHVVARPEKFQSQLARHTTS